MVLVREEVNVKMDHYRVVILVVFVDVNNHVEHDHGEDVIVDEAIVKINILEMVDDEVV